MSRIQTHLFASARIVSVVLQVREIGAAGRHVRTDHCQRHQSPDEQYASAHPPGLGSCTAVSVRCALRW